MIDDFLSGQHTRQLFIQDNRILLNSKKNQYTLQISLLDERIRKIQKTDHRNALAARQFLALYGIITLQVNRYLVLVSKANIVGEVFKQVIFQVSKLDFICLSKTESQIDQKYIQGVRDTIQNNTLYYSYHYDLTQNLQRFVDSHCSLNSPRTKYMYNFPFVSQLLEVQAHQWVTTFISGLVRIECVDFLNQKNSQLCIISRRDRRRQGMRFFTRGSNEKGHVANACESQMILTISLQKDTVQYFSHVQIRGSIPFVWNQDPDLKWTPKCKISSDETKNIKAFKQHFTQLKDEYRNCMMVNLIDKKGFQKVLGDYLERLCSLVDDPLKQILWFDFHYQSKINKGYLHKLVDQLSLFLFESGYFHCYFNQDQRKKIVTTKKQTGIVRTNCVDCLDRTNVVQVAIARFQISKWLKKLKLFEREASEFLDPLPSNLQQNFKQIWVSNANCLSRLYTGTNAMKTDISQNGKRTLKGKLNDAKIGIQRYFLGCFYDSRKQDYVHLTIGQLQPRKDKNERIRHSWLNSIHFLGAYIILTPLLTCMWIYLKQDEEQKPKIGAAAGIIGIAYLIGFKISRALKDFIIRRPIGIKNE